MAGLKDVLLSDDNRRHVVDDCVRLVDREVASKSGLGGVAVKGAYAIVKKIKPGIIREAVDRLLDQFVNRMQPFHDKFTEEGGTGFASYLRQRKGEVAGALLGVTDDRIANAENRVIKKAYGKLRPSGIKHVEAAVPGIGEVIEPYLAKASA